MIGIYKITSPTGRIYIGQSRCIEKRFSGYLRVNKNNHTVIRLFRSLKKYGADNHIFEVVEECSIESLNDRERHWQDFYDVCGINGLNCRLTSSSDKSAIISDETRKKMSISGKKKIMSDEHLEKIRKNAKTRIGKPGFPQTKSQREATKLRNKLSQAFVGERNPMYGSKRFGEKNPFYNKKHSKETRLKMSEYAKNRKISEQTRQKLSLKSALGMNNASKLVLNLETGVYYDCGKEAWMSTDKFTYSTFKSKLNGSNKHPLSFRYV